jgi:sulfatase maturation enzyme AslB (radical SAM superfamily)
LLKLWEQSPKMQETRDGAALWGYCKECYYAAECGGGCAWTSSVLFGKAGNNPYCFHRAERLAERGLGERLVRIEEAPGRPFDTGLFRLETAELNTLQLG